MTSATEAPPVAGMGESRAVPDYRDNLARALFEATYGKTLIAWSDATRDFWLARADASLTKPTPPACVTSDDFRFDAAGKPVGHPYEMPPASVSDEVVVVPRSALLPFAKAADAYVSHDGQHDFPDDHVLDVGAFNRPTVGDLRRIAELLAAASEAATPSAVGGAEAKGDTVAFVQKWMMSGDHEPDQWHRDFAAAIDDRVSGDGALQLIRGMLTSYAGQPNLYGDLFKIADAALAPEKVPSAVGGVDRMREAPLFTAESIAKAHRETERLSRELDITNADHIALWLEANLGDASLGWLAVRIVEAHEAALATGEKATRQ